METSATESWRVISNVKCKSQVLNSRYDDAIICCRKYKEVWLETHTHTHTRTQQITLEWQTQKVVSGEEWAGREQKENEQVGVGGRLVSTPLLLARKSPPSPNTKNDTSKSIQKILATDVKSTLSPVFNLQQKYFQMI